MIVETTNINVDSEIIDAAFRQVSTTNLLFRFPLKHTQNPSLFPTLKNQKNP